MGSSPEYRCDKCRRFASSRSALVAKTVTFRELGMGGGLVRSRTVAWLCGNCMLKDPAYNLQREDGPDARMRRATRAATRRT